MLTDIIMNNCRQCNFYEDTKRYKRIVIWNKKININNKNLLKSGIYNTKKKKKLHQYVTSKKTKLRYQSYYAFS